MDRYFTRIGGTIFALVMVLHLVRLFVNPDLAVFVPKWASVVLAAILLYGWIQYPLYHNKVTSRFTKIPYYLSALLFFLAFLVHSYRIFWNEQVFLLMPMWISYIAVPVTGLLAIYNFTLRLKK